MTPGDLQGRLGLTTMLTPSSTCHQSGSGPTSMIGARSPTPSPRLCYHHQHQISHYTHLLSVMCDYDPVPTLPRLAKAGSACIQCMLSHAQMIDCQHQVQPHRTMSKITITTTSALDLWNHPFNHLSPFLLIVSSCGN